MMLQPFRIRLDLHPDGIYEALSFDQPVPDIEQITDKFCWAACIRAECARRGQTISQETIASLHTGCPVGTYAELPIRPASCAPSVTRAELQDVWHKCGFNLATYHEGAIPEQALLEHLRSMGPVQIALSDHHVVMLDHWSRGPLGNVMVRYMDPMIPRHVAIFEQGLRLGEPGPAWTGTVTGLP
jgi:hypothetical protein